MSRIRYTNNQQQEIPIGEYEQRNEQKQRQSEVEKLTLREKQGQIFAERGDDHRQGIGQRKRQEKPSVAEIGEQPKPDQTGQADRQ